MSWFKRDKQDAPVRFLYQTGANDPEALSLGRIVDVLGELPEESRRRIIRYLMDRYDEPRKI